MMFVRVCSHIILSFTNHLNFINILVHIFTKGRSTPPAKLTNVQTRGCSKSQPKNHNVARISKKHILISTTRAFFVYIDRKLHPCTSSTTPSTTITLAVLLADFSHFTLAHVVCFSTISVGKEFFSQKTPSICVNLCQFVSI